MDADHILDLAYAETTGLLVEGPPGIGKSHALRELISRARSRGWRVLSASPAESEARLGGTALVDLCEAIGDDALTVPSPAQRAALAAALLRADSDTPADPVTVRFAFAHLLEALCAPAPVLVCVDDAQWLDRETESILEFAIRRSPARRLLWAFGSRPGALEAGLVAAFRDTVPLTRFAVPPLSRRSLEDLLRARIDASLHPDVLAWSAEVSGGNPFYALELARAARAGRPDTLAELPHSLEALVEARLAALPDRSLRAVAAAAALRRPDTATLSVLSLGDALPPAERADVVIVQDGAVRFTHPLLAAGAYLRLTGSEREALHREMAAAVDDPEERARHLVRGGERANADLAQALDDGAERAVSRGALQSAVESLRLALMVTPPGDPAAPHRRLRLGVLLFRSGLTDEARDVLEEVARTADHLRARALVELARLARAAAPFRVAAEAGELALRAAEEADDAGLRIDALVLLATLSYFPVDRALAYAETAVGLAEQFDEGQVGGERHAAAWLAAGLAAFKAGRGLDDRLFRRAMEAEAQHEAQPGTATVPIQDRAAAIYGSLLVDCGRLEEARALFDELEVVRRDSGDDASVPWLLGHRVKLELWSGRIDTAVRLAREHLAGSLGTAQPTSSVTARRSLAMVALHTGDLEVARRLAEELVTEGGPHGGFIEMMGRGLLGEVALAEGDHQTAATQLGRAEELRKADGAVDPAWSRWQAPYAEALVGLGRLAEADAEVGDLAERARAVGRDLALAAAERCRALIAADRLDSEEAFAALDRAEATLEKVGGFPAEKAYAKLTRGIVCRRFRQKAAARAALEAAIEEYTAIGAPAFAARARDELARIGGRTAGGSELTETERRVAALAATGMRVSDVAGALFVSPKTVEANLTRIYRKLGIRTRAELATWLARAAAEEPE